MDKHTEKSAEHADDAQETVQRPAKRTKPKRKKRKLYAWEKAMDAAFAKVPKEEWAKLPTDGSINHDHYLYGAPKR